MTERYLHDIWERKAHPIINYRLNCGQRISVIDHGHYNLNNSGPDFKFGCVQFEDVKMFGHIEMHLKSSDWYKHNHHLDVNYNSVILHVVFENDVSVVQNGHVIPFLELKNVVNDIDYQLYLKRQLYKNEFPCHYLSRSLDPVYFNSMITHSVELKFLSKMKCLKKNDLFGLKNTLYFLLAQSFGTGLNKSSFEQLANKLPLDVLMGLPIDKAKLLILSESELLLQEGFSSKNSFTSWHFKGTRPQNYPSIRVRQFSELATSLNYNLFEGVKSVIKLKSIFKNEIDRIWNLPTVSSNKLSNHFMNLVLINAIAPYLWYYAEFYKDSVYHDLAIDLLISIPAERNSISKKWLAINVKPNNAFESQGLIELYRYYCCRKKCLSCSVGQKVLK